MFNLVTKLSMRTLLVVVIAQLICVLLAQTLFERFGSRSVASFKNHGMALYELQLNTLQLRRYEKDYFLAANDPVERPRYLQLWRDYQLLVQGNLDQVRAGDHFSDAERKKLSDWTVLLRLYSRDFEANVAKTEALITSVGKIDDIVLAYSQMGEARKAIRVVLGQAQEISDTEYLRLSQHAARTTLLTRLLLGAFLLSSTLLVLLFAFKQRERLPRQAQMQPKSAASLEA
jgi:hypothetical protein